MRPNLSEIRSIPGIDYYPFSPLFFIMYIAVSSSQKPCEFYEKSGGFVWADYERSSALVVEELARNTVVDEAYCALTHRDEVDY